MQLFEKFDLVTIIEVIVLFSLSIKGCVSFLEWVIPRLKKFINKTEQPVKIRYGLQQQEKQINQIQENLKILIKKINTLMESDKTDIKAFITREHHYFVYQKGWIDDYSLDCIEQRYKHYVEEGGNSFIKGLMQEIRKLPKKPTETELKN